VLQLMEHETLSRDQVLAIFAPIRPRATRGSYTGYGKRLPSDRPPVLTPKEMALTAAPDGSEQSAAGNGQALSAGPDGTPPALGNGSPQGNDDGVPGASGGGGPGTGGTP
jgi:cell division protease FtsH